MRNVTLVLAVGLQLLLGMAGQASGQTLALAGGKDEKKDAKKDDKKDDKKKDSEGFNALPASQSCRIINFDKAYVRPGIVNGTYILIVSGKKPCLNMDVKLVPLVYVKQPDYWGIEVIGCVQGGLCLPVITPYTVSLPLNGILGTSGIEVIGANRTEQIDVPPGSGKKHEEK